MFRRLWRFRASIFWNSGELRTRVGDLAIEAGGEGSRAGGAGDTKTSKLPISGALGASSALEPLKYRHLEPGSAARRLN